MTRYRFAVWARRHVACALLSVAAAGQCGQWLSGNTLPGVNGPVNAVTPWDPDGAGPAPVRVAVGGWFAVAGNQPAYNVASVDPERESMHARIVGARFHRALGCRCCRCAVLVATVFVAGSCSCDVKR